MENKNNNSGKFRKKKIYFTQVSNIALRDKYLSFSAKGLYSLIQSYITMPNFDLYKSYLMEIAEEGTTAFNKAWKELKELGYLKMYKIKDEATGTYFYEYELLDEPELNDKDRFSKAKEIKKNVYKTTNHGFKKRGVVVSINGNNPYTQSMYMDGNVENAPVIQTVSMDKPNNIDCVYGEHESIIILNNNTYSVVVEEYQQQENVNATIVKTKCNLKRNLTQTQIDYVSTFNTDRLLKAIDIANEINVDSYTFGYIKSIYENDNNFMDMKKVHVTSNNKDFSSLKKSKNVNNSITQKSKNKTPKFKGGLSHCKTIIEFNGKLVDTTDLCEDDFNRMVEEKQRLKWG